VQRRENIQEVTGLGCFIDNGLDKRLAAVLDGRGCVGNDENAERRTGDNDELVGLQQHLEMSAKRCVAA
jgi:hypothetical protein